MGNFVRIRPYIPPPLGLERSVSASGGSGWSGTYSFALYAWYKPQEYSSMDCGIVPLDIEGSTGSAHTSDNLASGASDSITFSWALPLGRKDVHHFSIYRQAAASYNVANIGTKMLPSSGLLAGEIPGYATSCTITAPTARTYNVIMPVVRYVNTTKVAVAGDYTACKEAGLTITGSTHNDGTYSTTEAGLVVTLASDPSYGLCTLFTIGSGSFNTSVHDGVVQLTIGQPCQNTFYGEGAQVELTKVESFTVTTEPYASPDYEGISLPLSRSQTGNTSEIRVQVPISGISMRFGDISGGIEGSVWQGAHAYRLLGHWLQKQTYLEIIDGNTDSYSPAAESDVYYGTIKALPDPGNSKNENLSIEVVFDIDRSLSKTAGEQHNYDISSVSSGTNGTFTINNLDLRKVLPAGTVFEVEGSTGNDGFYVVSSISYGSFNSVITVRRSVASAVADGRIRVYVPR